MLPSVVLCFSSLYRWRHANYSEGSRFSTYVSDQLWNLVELTALEMANCGDFVKKRVGMGTTKAT